MASLGKPGLAVIDVGVLPADMGQLTLTCSGCLPTTLAMAQLCGQVAPGKDIDELEMDALHVWIETGVNQATLFIRGLEGYIHDRFAVIYCVG